jgi:hypothetical protein
VVDAWPSPDHRDASKATGIQNWVVLEFENVERERA